MCCHQVVVGAPLQDVWQGRPQKWGWEVGLGSEKVAGGGEFRVAGKECQKKEILLFAVGNDESWGFSLRVLSPKRCRARVVIGWVDASQLFTPNSSKIQDFQTCFSDIMVTHNGATSHVHCVLGGLCVFCTSLSHWDHGFVHNSFLSLPSQLKVPLFPNEFQFCEHPKWSNII